jgi:hypothetical protein
MTAVGEGMGSGPLRAEGEANTPKSGAEAVEDAINQRMLESPGEIADGVVGRAKTGDVKALGYANEAARRSVERRTPKERRSSMAVRWSAEPEWSADGGSPEAAPEAETKGS